MTFLLRSVVEFGAFYSRISECLISGAALDSTAELVRIQFAARAVALQIEIRGRMGQGQTVVMYDGVRMEAPLRRLAELLNTHHHIMCVAHEANGTRYTLWLFRDFEASNFDAEENSVCEIVIGQIRGGCELSARISTNEVMRTLYSTVMERLAVGVVILDLGGRIVHCSPKADETLAERDGLQLQAGKLRATCAGEDREFQVAIKLAAQAAASGVQTTRGMALTRLSGHRNLGAVVKAVPVTGMSAAIGTPTVAIFIRDPEASTDVEGELVRQLFDLTPAEAAVARRLAAGLSLEDAASSLDISRNTARAHLRSIFSKSGITRQTELVRLMLNSAAVLGERPPQMA